MKRPVLLEVTAKPIAPEVLAAYKDGKLDLRAIPPGSGSYLLQAWAVSIYGPGKPAEYAYGTALRKVGLIMGQRTVRPQADPGGSRMHPGTTRGGPATWMNYTDTPEKRLGNSEIAARARDAAGQVIEELAKAGFQPVSNRTGAGLIALGNILTSACQMAMIRPQGDNSVTAPPGREIPPRAIAAEGKTTVKRRFVIEAEPVELNGPPAQQIGDRLRAKMAKDLTDVAKDMMHGQPSRNINLLKGSARTAINVTFEGINDEEGLPVAYLRASVPMVPRGPNGRPNMVPYALVKIFHDVENQTVTKSPGKVVFADIIFSPTRGRELAQAFTKWVEAWVPIHQTSVEADVESRDDPTDTSPGQAVHGAKRKMRAHKQFVRLNDDIGVIDLSDYGFSGKDNLYARLMVGPIQKRPPALVNDSLYPFKVFSLHRTILDDNVDKDAIRNVEEEILVVGTMAIEDSGHHFTLFDMLFGDQLKRRGETRIISALIGAIMQASSGSGARIPSRFNKPTAYRTLNAALSKEERDLWDRYGTDEDDLNQRAQQQTTVDAQQQRINDDVHRRLMVDQEMAQWFPDPDRREIAIDLAIRHAIQQPRGFDITKVDRLLIRAKNIAQQRRST